MQETLAKTKLVREMPPIKVECSQVFRDKKEVESLFAGFHEVKNLRDGCLAVFPKDTAGKILRHKGFNAGKIADRLADIFRESVPAWSEPYHHQSGHKDHSSNIKAYHNYIGKFLAEGREYYVRFTLHEERARRGEGRNHVHSTYISDVSAYDATSGTASSRVRVIDPGVNENVPLIDNKLAGWFASVNPENFKLTVHG